MSRCVRQDFLLNTSETSAGISNYRNNWIESRLLFLADVFAIDLLSFAIMDNHTHTVLHVNLPMANEWSNEEVFKRWSKLGKLPLLCQLYLDIEWRARLNEVELVLVQDFVEEFRFKLTDLSTFMSQFNYYVARRANKEDGVKGHFWEARFKSQALLDVNALLACMAYVDLNPIRAGKAGSLEDSLFTSINRRLSISSSKKNTHLLPFRTIFSSLNLHPVLPINLDTYIKHLNSVLNMGEDSDSTTGNDKFVNNEDNWLEHAASFENRFSICAGESELVQFFTNQARLYFDIHRKEKRALADTILARLLDDQYQSDNKAPSN